MAENGEDVAMESKHDASEPVKETEAALPASPPIVIMETSAESKPVTMTTGKAPRPILSKDDVGQKSVRSGVLKMQLESTSVLFGRVTKWRERFVHIDQTEGIFFALDRTAFEKNDRKHMKILAFSDIAGVLLKKPEGKELTNATVAECRFVIYVKPRAQSTFGSVIELETPAGMEDAEEWVHALKQKILVKARVYTVGLNGEFPEHTRGVRPNVAICFSGGGGRAHVCASSQLRALHYLGLLNKSKIDYLSGVSAGAWATSIYTFYQKGAASDDELFGPLLATDLKKWTMQELETSPLSPILKPALESCMKIASELVWTVDSHELWEHVMGRIFLKPFGLFKQVPYAMAEDVEVIKRENPHLVNVKFITPKPNRPFWICHGTIIGPEWAKLGDLLPIQFTPLYVGSPYLHKIHYENKSTNKPKQEVVWVGGGMVDAFAFGGDEPTSIIGSNSNPMQRPSIAAALVAKPSFFRQFWSSWSSSSSSSFSTSPRNKKLMDAPVPTSPKSATAEAAAKQNLPPLASEAFAQRVMETLPKPSPLKTRTVPQYSNDIAEAVNSLNLAPQMVQRVFRHAQEALKSQSFYTAGKPKSGEDSEEDTKLDEGVLEKNVQLPYPAIPFSLRHTIGISSDAPSVNLHEKATFKRLNVQERYWTPVFVNATANKEGKEDAKAPQVALGTEFNMTQNIATTHAVTMDMGDGGSLDNLGVCGMLQRGVRKLIVFCNTNNYIPPPHFSRKEYRQSKIERDANKRMSISRLSISGVAPGVGAGDSEAPSTPSKRGSVVVREQSGGGERLSRRGSFKGMPAVFDKTVYDEILNDDFPPTYDEWADDDILPLFGQSVDEKMLNYLGTHHSHNHVFPQADLRPLLRKMQDKMIKGEPVVVRTQHKVLENSFWGIEGGWQADVLWVYLDDSSLFRASLPEDTMLELDKGKGEFARFPNFKTFGNNATLSFDISLTPKQINLLSAFTEYQVMYHKELFEEFINEECEPVQRHRKKVETCVNQLEKEGFC